MTIPIKRGQRLHKNAPLKEWQRNCRSLEQQADRLMSMAQDNKYQPEQAKSEEHQRSSSAHVPETKTVGNAEDNKK
ncbi:MAG: hypothetical protein ACWGQW_12345 [bacterium]